MEEKTIWASVRVPVWDVVYSITIPKSLAAAMGIQEGSTVKFFLNNKNEIIMELAPDNLKIRRVYKTISGALRVVIPQEVARKANIKRGDSIRYFTSGDGKIIIKKEENP